MRIAADTAILVRAHTKAYGPSRELLNIIRESGARLILSPFLVTEIERVLRYPRLQSLYGLSNEEIREYLDGLQAISDLVLPGQGPPIVVKDPEDDPVVYTALAGHADVLCTRDKHFYAADVMVFCAQHGILVMDDVALLHLLRRGFT